MSWERRILGGRSVLGEGEARIYLRDLGKVLGCSFRVRSERKGECLEPLLEVCCCSCCCCWFVLCKKDSEKMKLLW